MIEILKSMLSGHNQFASGGLLLMIIGGLGVYLRAVPQALWRWFISQTTMMIWPALVLAWTQAICRLLLSQRGHQRVVAQAQRIADVPDCWPESETSQAVRG
jgi:hypothetical protein